MVHAPQVPNQEMLSLHYSQHDRNIEVSSLTVEVYESWRISWFPSGLETHLDFGCGNGDLVNFMNSKGIRSVGCEIDGDIVTILKSKSIDVYETEEIVNSDLTFDIITIIEVLEHLPDPAKTLKMLASKLTPGGSIFITTPNFGSLNRRVQRGNWRIFSFPEHLNIFEKRTFKDLVSRCGLQLESVKTQGLVVSVGNSDNPETTPIQKILSVEKQRNFFVRNRFTMTLKRTINFVLNAFNLGDTLVAKIRLGN
jgi:SAM-dependent methyltransferase